VLDALLVTKHILFIGMDNSDHDYHFQTCMDTIQSVVESTVGR
jgi:hypothetical protein